MADDADRAQPNEEMLRRTGLANRPQYLPGTPNCLKCGEPNDRRQQGYGVCTDCVEEG